MKIKYTISTIALGLITLVTSCNKSDHADHDHGTETAEKHAAHSDNNHKDEHAGHDHSAHSEDDHDHSKCGVQIGEKGGRILTNIEGEVLLSAEGKLTVFIKKDVTLEKLTLLIDSEPTVITKGDNNTYTVNELNDKLPATMHLAAVVNGKKSIDSFDLNLTNCKECSNPEYICTCDNHNH